METILNEKEIELANQTYGFGQWNDYAFARMVGCTLASERLIEEIGVSRECDRQAFSQCNGGVGGPGISIANLIAGEKLKVTSSGGWTQRVIELWRRNKLLSTIQAEAN